MSRGMRWLFAGCGFAVLAAVAIPSGGLVDAEPTDWKRLGDDGFSWTLPAGWVAEDPFTTRTKFTTYVWFYDFPAHDERIALFHSADHGTDLIAMFGDRASVCTAARTDFTKYDDHPLVSVVGEDDAVTNDGVPIHWKAVRMQPGLIGGDDVTFFLAVAMHGRDGLVICGGGETEGFDVDASIELIESLRLG